MKHNAIRSGKAARLPLAWREAESAARRENAADTLDDRISEDIFDAEDERAEIDIIARTTIHGAQ